MVGQPPEKSEPPWRKAAEWTPVETQPAIDCTRSQLGKRVRQLEADADALKVSSLLGSNSNASVWLKLITHYCEHMENPGSADASSLPGDSRS
jgi:hypothetical protein